MLPRSIKKDPVNHSFLFSICTIVTNWKEYEEAKQSFEACDFKEDCEYLIAENTSGNQFSAYEAISGFFKQSSASYLILVHQDVRCIDNKERLIKCLNELTQLDNKWAVCGNAGSLGYHEERFYLNNAGKEIITQGLPAQVTSLDENLLIINRNTNITLSSDLADFHFYGTDLCLVADFLGYNCYVIPFMVQHLSLGNIEELVSYKAIFIRRYARKFRNRFIETTCTKFYLSNSSWKNKFFNSLFIFPFVKFFQRIRYLVRRLSPRTTSFKTVKKKADSFQALF